MKKTKIGVFDSGIGGITVLRECMKKNPDFEYLYYSDSLHNPYGDKPKEEVLGIVSKIVSHLIDEGCYIIVIACNTASAICVEYLREKYPDIWFVAIEPAIKCAYDFEDKSGTLIMATKGTMDSEKFHLLYDKYHHNDFYLLSCVGLANIIEGGNEELLKQYLIDTLHDYKGKVHSVVLGCTHYPLIKKEICEVLGNVHFYDGAIGVAKQLNRIIQENHFEDTGNSRVLFYDSSCDEGKEQRFRKLLEDVYE